MFHWEFPELHTCSARAPQGLAPAVTTLSLRMDITGGPWGCGKISGWFPNWLVVWLPFFELSHSVGNVIIPSDVLHHFSGRGGYTGPPTRWFPETHGDPPIFGRMVSSGDPLGIPQGPWRFWRVPGGSGGPGSLISGDPT